MNDLTVVTPMPMPVWLYTAPADARFAEAVRFDSRIRYPVDWAPEVTVDAYGATCKDCGLEFTWEFDGAMSAVDKAERVEAIKRVLWSQIWAPRYTRRRVLNHAND